jgi:hypothetical protein
MATAPSIELDEKLKRGRADQEELKKKQAHDIALKRALSRRL